MEMVENKNFTTICRPILPDFETNSLATPSRTAAVGQRDPRHVSRTDFKGQHRTATMPGQKIA
jgi:hypothetical protein